VLPHRSEAAPQPPQPQESPQRPLPPDMQRQPLATAELVQRPDSRSSHRSGLQVGSVLPGAAAGAAASIGGSAPAAAATGVAPAAAAAGHAATAVGHSRIGPAAGQQEQPPQRPPTRLCAPRSRDRCCRSDRRRRRRRHSHRSGRIRCPCRWTFSNSCRHSGIVPAPGRREQPPQRPPSRLCIPRSRRRCCRIDRSRRCSPQLSVFSFRFTI
jgi:hypothetical protein